MIVSHQHRFVFLKTVKTAGTSVEVLLRRFCGPDDIVTPITPIDEQAPVAAGLTPRNYAADPALEHQYCALVAQGRLDEALAYHRQGNIFANHMDAAALRARLGAELLQDYFVFTIERHPYDRAISRAAFDLGMAAYRSGQPRKAEPDAIIEHLRRRIAAGAARDFSNWHIYTIGNRVVADAVVFYERMQAGLETVLSRLGLEGEVDLGESLPHLKGGIRPRGLTGAMLPDDCKRAIQVFCAREFETFGYKA